jgi:alkanesulfonate monooxygenase SsuD/methylene tetrahydromethanopterin reductase-like flavin-dependent oxidoreductase (luciferase family)
MHFGIFPPYLMPKPLERETADAWFERIDAGPYATFAYGERAAWHTHDQFTMLGAAAMATKRVRLMTYVTILPVHPAPHIAKRAATVDVLSGGRLTLAVGAGPRTADWEAADRRFVTNPQKTMDRQVADIRRFWSGDPLPGGEPLLPAPVQAAGPPILSAARGDKSTARAVTWADGYAGFIAPFTLPPADDARRFTAAWERAGRHGSPYLVTSCFFALGGDASERLHRVAGPYMAARPLPGGPVAGEAFTVDTPDALRRVVHDVEEAGFDELILIPTTDELAELDRLEKVLTG